MPATYCPEKGDRRVTFFRDERYLVHTISDVAIKYSKGRMIRQQLEGHDTFEQICPLSRTEQKSL